MITPSAGVQML